MGLFDKLFKSLGNALSEKEPEEKAAEPVKTPESKETPEPKKAPEPKNAGPVEQLLESKEDLLRNILNVVGKIYDDESETTGKRIVVWLDTDQLTFDDYEKYKKRILQALVVDRGYKFESVNFEIGHPDDSLRCTPIHNNGKEFIQIVDTSNIIRKAVVTIHDNRGSLMKEQYVLSPADMQKQNISCYNIGCGESPMLNNGFRCNHIAIDDNPDGPMIALNKYVSRAHAHIGYSDKFGFYLQVELGGTHQAGKRTRIFRGDATIEIDNIGVKEPLINGDIIELGKSVCLKFVEI